MKHLSQEYIKSKGLTAAKRLIETHGTPTLFLSRKRIWNAYNQLSKALPQVQLYYAVKCNSHQQILHDLNSVGCGFDVSTNKEIDLVLIQRASVERCIHTHPIKKEEDITYALKRGIKTFVVDNQTELQKFLPYKKDLRILIRLAISNSKVFTDLSKKFGVLKEVQAIDLIRKASEIGFKDLGICFHPGSQCINPNVVRRNILFCNKIINKLDKEGISINTIDIGGGFPVPMHSAKSTIEQYCSVFYPDLKKMMDRGIQVLAEPGRFLAADTMFLATKVVGKSVRKSKRWYFIDDGVYNSFSGKLFDHARFPFHLLKENNGKHFSSVIAGPTCDSVDVVVDEVKLRELEIGDVIVFDKMGAYTSESATTFNGFSKTKIVVLNE